MSSYILNSRQLRATVIFDCIHKLWRCLWGGVQDASLAAAIFVGSVICNLDRATFKGEGNWQKLKESFSECYATRDHKCPLFAQLVNSVMRDKGELTSLDITDEDLKAIWDGSPDAPWLRQKRAPRSL